MFSVIWGVCFSLKANPNDRKKMDSGTVLAQGDAPAFGNPGESLLQKQEFFTFWHTVLAQMAQSGITSYGRAKIGKNTNTATISALKT